MISEFTFGILLYNQEKLIVETLESIKYQKQNYGEKLKVNLIIVDDASKDESVRVATKWVEKNRDLFNEVSIICNNNNCGTVSNYNLLLEKVEGDYFKVIAGDDVFSSRNLFEKFDKLKSNSLICFQRVELCDGRLGINEILLEQHFGDRFCTKYKDKLRRMRKGCFIHTPSAIYKKELYVQCGAKDFNRSFFLLEDDPTWYSMIKKGADVLFDDDFIVLYRMHQNSASNSSVNNEVTTAFCKDMKKLHSVYCDDTKGFEHIYWKNKISYNKPKLFRVDKYIDRFVAYKNRFSSKHSKKYRLFVDELNEKIKKEQLYYNTIKNSSEEFLRSIYDI